MADNVGKEVYFNDVRLQLDAKLWGEEYSRHNPPKKVQIIFIYSLFNLDLVYIKSNFSHTIDEC